MLPMILKLSDKVKIDGESLVKGYEKQIDVISIDHGISMPMVNDKSSNTRTAGRCLHGQLSCLVRLNKSYPKLVEACAKGSNLGKAELVMVKTNESKVAELAKYTLTDVYVSKVELANDANQALSALAQGDASLPLFRVSLNYQSISIVYNEYAPTGESRGAVSCDALTGLGA